MSAIHIEQLQKNYGRTPVLRGVSLTVERGQIFGLLGQNGAGKTTLIKILLGLVYPSGGKARLLDEPVGLKRVRQRVGYLPEDHRFPDYHTGKSLLDFYGQLYGLSSAIRRQRIPELIDLVGLRDRANAKIRTYSKGMRQRIGIAQAVMHQPEVLFLDEPTDGVDPLGRREIRDILLKLKSQGTTIFLNSHQLGEVEQVCDLVAIMQRGEIVVQGETMELTSVRGIYRIGLAPNESLAIGEWNSRGYTIREVPDGVYELALRRDTELDEFLAELHSQGLHLRHLVEKRLTLEDVYLSVVGANVPMVRAVAPRFAPIAPQEN